MDPEALITRAKVEWQAWLPARNIPRANSRQEMHASARRGDDFHVVVQLERQSGAGESRCEFVVSHPTYDHCQILTVPRVNIMVGSSLAGSDQESWQASESFRKSAPSALALSCC